MKSSCALVTLQRLAIFSAFLAIFSGCEIDFHVECSKNRTFPARLLDCTAFLFFVRIEPLNWCKTAFTGRMASAGSGLSISDELIGLLDRADMLAAQAVLLNFRTKMTRASWRSVDSALRLALENAISGFFRRETRNQIAVSVCFQ